MRTQTPLGLLLILILLAYFTSLSLLTASLTWNVQHVGYTIASSDVFMALDSQGNPHLAFSVYVMNKQSYDLDYASWNDSNWNFQTVTSGPALAEGLVLDSKNNPHILYYDSTSQSGLQYASWSGSYWTFQNFGNQGGDPPASIALDSEGNPHVAYNGANPQIELGGSNNYLKYASWTGTSWNVQTLEQIPSNSKISLALDKNNIPHIMYEIGTGTSGQTSLLRYAFWDNISNSWDYQTIWANASIRQMALDSNDSPHYVSLETNPPYINSTMIYGYLNGSYWQYSIVSSKLLDYNNDVYLALDANNNPHVVWSNLETGLQYATLTGNTWDIQTIDPGSVLSGPIALDSSGNPHISYFGGYASGKTGIFSAFLMYATATPSEPTPTAAPTPVASNGNFTFLVVFSITIIFVLVVLFLLTKKKKNQPPLT